MKFWIFLSLALLQYQAEAQSVLIRAAGASPVTYESFVRQNPKVISYLDYQQRKLQNQPEQEKQIFALADSFATSPDLTLLHLKGLQAKGPWTLMSLRFVRDLTEKTIPSASGALKRDLQSLYCKTAVLLSEGSLAVNCATQFVSLEKISKKFPKVEKVLIESLGFGVTDLANPIIAAQTNYHWTLISNAGHAVSFYGTYDQVFAQSFTFNDLVSGTCDAFNIEFADLSFQSEARIYFSDSCQKSATAPADPSRFGWIKEERTWWIAAGLAVLGGIAYSLKDKKVTVNPIGLKF